MRSVAIISTWFYIGFIFGLISRNWERFKALTPNEWGDFLAGTVGPVAFLWLIYSVWIQSRELENSRNALESQLVELASSARAHRDQVEASNKNIDQQNRIYKASLWLKTKEMESELGLKIKAAEEILGIRKYGNNELGSLLDTIRMNVDFGLHSYYLPRSSSNTTSLKSELQKIQSSFKENFPIPNLDKYENDELRTALIHELNKKIDTLITTAIKTQAKK